MVYGVFTIRVNISLGVDDRVLRLSGDTHRCYELDFVRFCQVHIQKRLLVAMWLSA